MRYMRLDPYAWQDFERVKTEWGNTFIPKRKDAQVLAKWGIEEVSILLLGWLDHQERNAFFPELA